MRYVSGSLFLKTTTLIESSDSAENANGFSPSPDGIERLLEIRGVGRPTARRILETFGTVDEATSAPTHELTEIREVGQGIAARITSKTGRQTSPEHDQSQSTTTAKSETSPESKNNDSIEILDEIANEFEEL